MSGIVGLVKSTAKPLIASSRTKTDNVVFRLHTRVTVTILAVSCAIVTAKTYIGDPIHCASRAMSGDPVKTPAILDTYCWIHSTFTLPKRIYDPEGEYSDEVTAHPGVGVPLEEEPTTYHKFYQWVCFALFFQAMCFHFPRRLWKHYEGDKMHKLIPAELIFTPSDANMPNFPKVFGKSSI